MVTHVKKFISADWCFIGVIVFFILHGYTDNENVVPFRSVLPLLAELLIAGILVFFISRLLLRNTRKANIFTSIAFIIILFFGVVQDYLMRFRMLETITRFRTFVPLCLLLIVIAFIWLKRSNKPLNKAVLFLNTLLIIYLLVDACTLVKAGFFSSKPQHTQLAKYNLSNCDTCQKPPVYLILFDSYFGSKGLKEYFHYNNARFEQELTGLGFHVVKASHSNYKYTVFSMASLLNMSFLPNVGEIAVNNHYGYNTAVSTIKSSAVCQYFIDQGYRVNNYSIFDILNIPAGYSSGQLPEKVELINSQTMYHRIQRYLPGYLYKSGLVKLTTTGIEQAFMRNVESEMEGVIDASHANDKRPAFTYLHLLIPHAPFLFDSTGSPSNYLQKRDFLPKDSLDNMFLQYEVYANKIITGFINRLKTTTGGRAVILLMSDHGYQDATGKNEKLPFYNLNAIYLPRGNYQGWYNGISNVNQFRVLFNTLFHQQIAILSDSIVVH